MSLTLSRSAPKAVALRKGKYHDHLPKRLATTYQDALGDDELLSMKDEIALLDSMITEKVETLSTSPKESIEAWKQALFVWDRLITETREDRKEEALQKLGLILQRGAGEMARIEEVLLLIDARKKIVSTETKRLAVLGQFITAAQAKALLAKVIAVIHKRVTDERICKAISEDLARLDYTGSDQRDRSAADFSGLPD